MCLLCYADDDVVVWDISSTAQLEPLATIFGEVGSTAIGFIDTVFDIVWNLFQF